MRVNGKRVFDGEPELHDHIEVWTGPTFQIRYKRRNHQVILRPTSPWEDLLEWIRILGGNLEELRIRTNVATLAPESDLHPDVPLFVGAIPKSAAKWKFEEKDAPPAELDPSSTDSETNRDRHN
jgi:hypothetical protein